ncbi:MULTISPECIES: 1-deoxy-D-xylulose-5-phosphate reductoisomerase [Heyndrickxia]|jgi:1-deoxy-D-xylulose-5-phosphate reductoisomerase|uniref:1-deoxy-D-xylulose-5-phosphate reductoisomerase n=1 Tax=Heyndrickxia TaxID=2837504 RepID=UPI0007173DEA|nr:1-deoxy-D-xylulose-5-phosphate reductoisomerase [Heyndrickxia oleronia]NYV67025.1 1-deoxy-D-xylulose-5-phosphate reductoisomerase [Bacillus sp. Gen3]OJH18084.1 1-deoxy-D-xylulose-5-phosphate reductoisomerase [Bacillus obstructivus]MBU5211147.1 1-deoxy-D-xylulose-5-phosphate reductoisomerase [Heyndrickxia oleronia]MCI1589587.1 1-deoxy-D-xylulose-5-phosphate reductoisomerase [Heyndrickxia oleronia]MCI1613322.1 1-deoxy-D-xylulose-5-phosphate reductoisomerase [Heyndrickxia oleronia]
MKYISLMGATGSIGTQTLDVIRNHPEQFCLVAISVGKNIELTRKIITEFKPEIVSVQNQEDYEKLKAEYGHSISFSYGQNGLLEVATYEKATILVNAVMGSVGLFPTLHAIQAGKTIALANKETLVTAGHLVMSAAEQHGVSILPVDSEHSAIFQCLQGEKDSEIDRLIITASGGSFRDKTREDLIGVTVEEALNHPNWSMGAKITIDSATMMNKGLEVIEAHWLFDIPFDKIDVVLHRESIIHSMVEFQDTSIKAQLGSPDMRVAIQYALSYPNRLPLPSGKRLNLEDIGKLNFEKMDYTRFHCLKLAYDAGRTGGSLPTVLNAANEAAVNAFLNKKIAFLQIDELIERALDRHNVIKHPDLDTIKEIDQETRVYINTLF